MSAKDLSAIDMMILDLISKQPDSGIGFINYALRGHYTAAVEALHKDDWLVLKDNSYSLSPRSTKLITAILTNQENARVAAIFEQQVQNAVFILNKRRVYRQINPISKVTFPVGFIGVHNLADEMNISPNQLMPILAGAERYGVVYRHGKNEKGRDIWAVVDLPDLVLQQQEQYVAAETGDATTIVDNSFDGTHQG